jgi:DnaK suppressor protein
MIWSEKSATFRDIAPACHAPQRAPSRAITTNGHNAPGRQTAYNFGRLSHFIDPIHLLAASQLKGTGGLLYKPAAEPELASKNNQFRAWESEQMRVAEKVKSYRPTDKEPFMNERQRDYFRQKLLAWREDILKEAKETLQHLQDENQNHPDLADRASSETDRAIELRARDRQRKLIAKIDAALTRIEDGTYGYCEETGEPISIKRLEARPIATLSIEAQERHERRERVYRDE